MSGETVLLIKGAISELKPEEQQRVVECYTKIHTIVTEYGELGVVALALLGAQLEEKAG